MPLLNHLYLKILELCSLRKLTTARFGEWVVLIRLESITPARFDMRMRNFLLNQELDKYLDNRIILILSDQIPEPLHFAS